MEEIAVTSIRSVPSEVRFPSREEMGFFGNVWVRMNHLPKAGDFLPGHTHHHDHVSLLVSGTVRVEVDGYAPTEFTGPTYIIIKKEHRHKFTALTDNVLWYCVFALRDVDGQQTDLYDGRNSPYGTPDSKMPRPEDCVIVETPTPEALAEQARILREIHGT